MKAFAIDRYKSKDRGRIVDLPQPEVGDNDVLVQIHAAGVNLLDAKLADGEFKIFLPYQFPLVLGNDVAGVVVEVGARVRRFKPGDEVYARPDKDRIGTFAEFISMNEADVAIKPTQLSMEEAASIPLVGLTAWQALVEMAELKPGQKVFIQAGTGGVGTFAIQLAKHLGATVATTASAANFDMVNALGADVLIDYKTEDFETVLHGYDVVLHSQDSKTLDKSFRVLKPGGKAHLHIRTTRPGLCGRDRRALVRQVDNARLELRRKAKGQAPQRHVLVLVHEGGRRSIERDHRPHRPGSHSPGHGQGVSLRRDPGRFGFRRKGTGQRQGRRQRAVSATVSSSAIDCDLKRHADRAHSVVGKSAKAADQNGDRDTFDESRFTAERRGTGSESGSKTTSLASPRMVVVHGATIAR